MFQSCWRGHQAQLLYVQLSLLYHSSATKIQIFYKSYSANMRWRGISRKIMQRCMEQLKKIKAMNLVLSNARDEIEREEIKRKREMRERRERREREISYFSLSVSGVFFLSLSFSSLKFMYLVLLLLLRVIY